MQTARYYFTAADLGHPEISSTTSVVMKKTEYNAILTPNPATTGEYVSITGNAERGILYVLIEVTDNTGKILHSYTSPVSASGYFNYGYHVDMQPGQYTIKVSNPSIKNSLLMVLTIVPPQKQTPKGTILAVTPANSTQSIPVSIPASSAPSQTPPAIATGNGTLSLASTPAGAAIYIDSVMVGITPMDLDNLSYGTHQIEITSPGYLPYSVQVTVREGAPVILSPVLLQSPSSIPLSPVTTCMGIIIFGAIALVRSERRKNQ
jgi:hypothetical protein